MENFNKVLSFILGLVIVVVFIAVLSGRIKVGNFSFLSSGKTVAKPSITPTITPPTTVRIVAQTASSKTQPQPTQTQIKGQTQITPSVQYRSTTTNSAGTTSGTTTYKTQGSVQTGIKTTQPTTIPNTGAPSLLLPLLASGIGAGVFLKRRK